MLGTQLGMGFKGMIAKIFLISSLGCLCASDLLPGKKQDCSKEMERKVTQYDNIASEYDASAEERTDRGCVLVPSAKHYIGNVKGLKVLDLACGSGFFTRLIKQMGAAKVVGVDVSEEMIQIAHEQEKKSPFGIEYLVGDASTLGKLDDFDVIFAGFLLHYAESPNKLSAMCANIARNMKKGARFITFNENPVFPLHAGIKYGVETKAIGPVVDGVQIERTHYSEDGIKQFSFKHYHYDVKTYEAALKGAGLTDIQWKPFVTRVDADRGLALGYWDDYLGSFSITVLIGRKP